MKHIWEEVETREADSEEINAPLAIDLPNVFPQAEPLPARKSDRRAVLSKSATRPALCTTNPRGGQFAAMEDTRRSRHQRRKTMSRVDVIITMRSG